MAGVRRDGKDNAAIANVITKEFHRCVGNMAETNFMNHMRIVASACWVRVSKTLLLFLDIIGYYTKCY